MLKWGFGTWAYVRPNMTSPSIKWMWTTLEETAKQTDLKVETAVHPNSPISPLLDVNKSSRSELPVRSGETKYTGVRICWRSQCQQERWALHGWKAIEKALKTKIKTQQPTYHNNMQILTRNLLLLLFGGKSSNSEDVPLSHGFRPLVALQPQRLEPHRFKLWNTEILQRRRSGWAMG